MDDNNDVVTTEELAAAVIANSQDDGSFEWHGLSIKYRPRLSLADMKIFVDTVTDGCFDSESGMYAPEAKHFALQLAIVAFYTNIDLGDDLSVQYELLTASDLADVVSDHVDKKQLDSVLGAIDENIRYRTESNVYELQEKIERAYGELESAVGQMREAFDGVTGEDFGKLVGALAGGGFDEGKLVDAILDERRGQRNPDSN